MQTEVFPSSANIAGMFPLCVKSNVFSSHWLQTERFKTKSDEAVRSNWNNSPCLLTDDSKHRGKWSRTTGSTETKITGEAHVDRCLGKSVRLLVPPSLSRGCLVGNGFLSKKFYLPLISFPVFCGAFNGLQLRKKYRCIFRWRGLQLSRNLQQTLTRVTDARVMDSDASKCTSSRRTLSPLCFKCLGSCECNGRCFVILVSEWQTGAKTEPKNFKLRRVVG